MRLKPGSVLALYWADLHAYRFWGEKAAHDRGTPEPDVRGLSLALLRALVNPALRLVLALRLANASPRLLWPFWRNYFVHLHTMDWSGRVEIGPGLAIPHPFGVSMIAGTRIGKNASIGHFCTFAGDADGGTPVLGDGILLYPGVVIAGGIEIGDSTAISPNCVVREDVPAYKLVTERGVVPITKARQLWPMHPTAGADDGTEESAASNASDAS
ncbi:MAG: hypothetical protein WD649_04250 [Thermoleophilaceae bacterium]